MSTPAIHRKGFGLGAAIADELTRDYHSKIVAWFRGHDHTLAAGNTTLLLARELGFCYGVDRAVEYAYETRRQFPDRRIHITGEIIHNPHVNGNLRRMDIRFLSQPGDANPDFRQVEPGDVVILPAFGARAADLDVLRARGAVLVDTTCGSVLNVWKSVQRYARDGYTSVIHGKYAHEETRATASWAEAIPGGRYLVVRDMDEADVVCRYIESGGERAVFLARFGPACSGDFDPDRDLARIGVANQTTMLSTESLAIAGRIGQALGRRYGAAALAEHFRSFDTICSATQERQDAVAALLAERLDTLIVIGGYNSSNTTHLAEMAAGTPTRAFHIEDAGALADDGTIRHRPTGGGERVEHDWLPEGPVRIGVTAGASTPNNRIGEVLERLLRLRGVALPPDLA